MAKMQQSDYVFFDWLAALQAFIASLSPYQFVQTGIYTAISLSIIGAGTGIMMIGASLTQATIHHPEIKSKNLLSILFCEAIALYGIIMGIILFSSTGAEQANIILNTANYDGPRYYTDQIIQNDVNNLATGFSIGFGGITVGCCNIVAALTVGILGSSVVIAHSNSPAIFVKLFIAEVFAEAIALIGLIAGIVMSLGGKFK
ncbi:Vacuolar ATP synthase 16 kDa proteolipid subunit [Spironucleus salmonicida]|uniref:Vacuolar ATP synthase 16 kDa proteolipid subunit n=1 Tax=Spironucleus salmonicida TaxID=348837 RepID=V6LLU7_9EUKA|nr:Vacuolar ATP synthase 16 kDa proteolipid subunit [Spironucleus salmonicida]|eukprot:EST45173.1 Vacuolar ATP synthase 16 kDa proteolipid subunit [Spironucleus salmonicida]